MDVFRRRISEEASVLAGELRGAGVADAAARLSRVEHCGEHQAPGLLQAERFLVLQRTHAGHGFELPVKRRDAQVHEAGELPDVDGLIEVRP